MKKVLSILLSICMLVGCFVAMIPSANAAVSNPQRFPTPYRDTIIYKEDFESDAVVNSADSAALFAALGWGGTVGGSIAVVKDTESDNHRMQVTGATESMIVCKDDRLIGGGYIVEYTAIMTKRNPNDKDGKPVDGSGMGFRSSYNIEEAGWNFLAKERGNFDFHFHTKDVSAGSYHEENDIATRIVVSEADPKEFTDRKRGSIVGEEIRFRLVIDPINGLSAYTIDLETGEATIVVGMNADKVSSWAASAHTLNDELILRSIDAKTQYLVDDIEIYTLDTKNYSIPDVFGYQTTALTGETYDIRFLAKIEKNPTATRFGYKVEYRYLVAETDTLYQGTSTIACNYIYTEVTTDNGANTIAYEDFKVLALNVNGVPTDHNITFTVTPFASYWSEFGCEEVYEYGTPVSYTVIIPD